MKKLYTILFSLLIEINNMLWAADAAPSCHLYYSGGYANADIWMNSVNVSTSTMYTYYSVMGWNTGAEGGGYCGIQDHPDGKNFIFSIWDPSNQQKIIGAYAGPGTNIENFGGEGTGLKSWNFKLGWKTGTWYTLVTRVWQKNGHTFFGFWSQDQSTQIWTHLVTMDYPVANVTLNGGNDAFIEDWIGSGANIRKVLFKDAWQRSTTGTWKLLKNSGFSANAGDAVRNGIYDQAFNAGEENGAFFMQTGGNTTHSFSGRSTSLSISSTATSPNTTTGEINHYLSSYNANTKMVNVFWDINQYKSPQHAYTFEVFDNPNFTGAAKITYTDKVPQQRTLSANVASLANGTYYTRLTITDIFDNVSLAQTSNFNIGNSPIVTITSPVNNATMGIFLNATITATATSSTSGITKMEFYADNLKLGEDFTAPYQLNTIFQSKGKVKITAIAYDANQWSGSSDIMINTEFLCTQLTGTALGTSPAYLNGSSTYDKVFDNDTTTFFDYANANGGYAGLDLGQGAVINGITFFPRSGNESRMIGGKFQGSNVANFSSGVVDLYIITSTPSSGWNEAPINNYNTFRYLRYLSPNGGYANIAEAKFCGVLNSNNQKPSIVIITPISNSTYNTPANIQIEADASDSDGIITKVEFFNNNTLIGTSTSSPYTFTWNNVPIGTYQINAKATDNQGGTKDATAITVVVNAITSVDNVNTEMIQFYPNPANSTITCNKTFDEISVHTISGKQLSAYQNTNSIVIADLPTGIYWVKLKLNDLIYVSKMIKE